MAITIDGKTYRNQQEQIYKNMEDIQELQDIIKPEYTTASTLTSSSTSIAIANTNAPSGTKSGWLLTQDGLKFKITGGDDTNLLLEYYADLKGPQGENGAALNIDDSTTSATKVWSSQKVNTEIGNAKDKGIYFTTTAPTELSDPSYTIAPTDIVNKNDDISFKAKDIIVYVNNGTVESLYQINAVANPLQLSKVATFSQGTQLYQHNIYGFATNVKFTLTIKNAQATEMNASDIMNWLKENGFRNDTTPNHFYNEFCYIQSGSITSVRIAWGDDTWAYAELLSGTNTGLQFSGFTIRDKVIAL